MSYTDDYYFKKAKELNLRARSYFKLEEIDKRYSLIKAGQNILDLGACPGSWSQYCIATAKGRISITGVDISDFQPVPGCRYTRRVRNIYQLQASELDSRYDGIISDMAPATSGMHDIDSAANAELIRRAVEIADMLTELPSFFIAKYLLGEDIQELKKLLKDRFSFVKAFKPKSSRPTSTETFLIARDPKS